MLPSRSRSPFWLALAGLLLFAPAARSQDRTLDLPLGDPARRERTAPVLLDGITATATGDLLTPAELAARLDPVEALARE